ncbi:arginase family protein [Nocardioides bruguierae]|uniref:arginase family protein n=1 Tax=Nocardioides bruguierae TaxID=2945102 RepID=UPI0020210419|nr:arginase family protein [Nocardioides bruguierae]MCL8023945.1 arginase family protein [Nocardioides bruguierae]
MPSTTSSSDVTGPTLRLYHPQWQGCAAENMVLVPELPPVEGRRGYSTGTTVLEAVLPPHDGPVAHVEVPMGETGDEVVDGIESKGVVADQLDLALRTLEEQRPGRVVTVGGECSVSVAPFSWLAAQYPDDVAVVWLDSHPDVGTPDSEYHGYHAMAVAMITGHGDKELVDRLPGTVDASRVALAGLHSWTEDDFPNAAAWGITTFAPDDLRTSGAPLVEWLASTGCSKVAIHLDVDVVDADEVVLGLGMEPGGLTTDQVARVVADVSEAADVVGMTVAEYVPRQVIRTQALLRGMPLI